MCPGCRTAWSRTLCVYFGDRLISRPNRLPNGIGHVARVVRLDAHLDVAKLSSEGAIAKDFVDPAGEVMRLQMSSYPISRESREQPREFLQRAGPSAGPPVAREDECLRVE